VGGDKAVGAEDAGKEELHTSFGARKLKRKKGTAQSELLFVGLVCNGRTIMDIEASTPQQKKQILLNLFLPTL
jgi:hypothetical protein